MRSWQVNITFLGSKKKINGELAWSQIWTISNLLAFFFKVKEKKKIMMRNIKTIFNKAELTEKEVKILLGIIKNLTK